MKNFAANLTIRIIKMWIVCLQIIINLLTEYGPKDLQKLLAKSPNFFFLHFNSVLYQSWGSWNNCTLCIFRVSFASFASAFSLIFHNLFFPFFFPLLFSNRLWPALNMTFSRMEAALEDAFVEWVSNFSVFVYRNVEWNRRKGFSHEKRPLGFLFLLRAVLNWNLLDQYIRRQVRSYRYSSWTCRRQRSL